MADPIRFNRLTTDNIDEYTAEFLDSRVERMRDYTQTLAQAVQNMSRPTGFVQTTQAASTQGTYRPREELATATWRYQYQDVYKNTASWFEPSVQQKPKSTSAKLERKA